jgi:GTP pyrophosphokinase
MLALKGMHLAPYIQVATALIGKSRYGGGNMFRHQMDTLAILIDYGYVDPVLLKASIIHDVVEDIPEYDRGLLGSIDDDAPEVVELVLEVSRRPGEGKADYLKRVAAQGSARAKILKVADRISNVVSLGFVTDALFVERYIKETEAYVLPIALEADPRMAKELADLLASRSSCGG